MVPPGFSRLSASAASIMKRAGRSLMDPEGLALSSFKNSWNGPQSNLVSSISGVSPMRSRTEAMKQYSYRHKHCLLRLCPDPLFAAETVLPFHREKNGRQHKP